MRSAPLPENEEARQKALDEHQVLDTPGESAYDDLVRLASYICRTPIALVSLIDRDRQWFKARIGLDVTETPRDAAFCAHAILQPGELLVVPDAARDARFADNPLVTSEPRIRFYAGAPLVTSTGEALGTLCVIDREPRELTEEQATVLRALSRQVMSQLEMRRSIESLESVIADRNDYVEQLEVYQRGLEEKHAKLNDEVLVDALTGARNRRALDAVMAEEIPRSRRHRTPLSLMLLDVDYFKQYNDRYGHPAGDAVLRDIVSVLRFSLRPHDVIARYGGEEFAVLLPATDPAGARVLAERCRRGIERSSWPDRSVTASFGVATLADHMDAAALLSDADQALYRAKREGRNRVAAAP